MNLYLLSQNVTERYDTYDSCVVAADTPEEAVKVHPDGRKRWDGRCWVEEDGRTADRWSVEAWCVPGRVTCTRIGVADDSATPGVVIASFNAG